MVYQCALFSACLLAATFAHGAPGDWPEPRQNPHLTARQPLAGNMQQAPETIASFDLGRGAPSLTPVTQSDGATVGVSIVDGALYCFDTEGNERWRSHPAGLNYEVLSAFRDFNSDGTIELLLQCGRPAPPYGAAVLVSLDSGEVLWRYDVDPMSYAWYLYAGHYVPGRTDEQIVVMMHGYPPDAQNGYIALFSFLPGTVAPAQQWRYDFSEYTCFPSLLQSDLDGDGKQEIVVETHSRMWYLDAESGALEHFAKWDVSPANVRSYGLVEFVDLNRDGRDDFLCIANFAQHHEVLLNRDGKMEKAWSHGWPESVTIGKVVTVYPEPAYADLDGDGGYEVVVSMFNSEEESAWLLRAYDALTGELKFREPGVMAVALKDMDGDGRAEVLGNLSKDPTKTQLDGAVLLQVHENIFRRVFEDPAATALAARKDDAPLLQIGEKRFEVTLDTAGNVQTAERIRERDRGGLPVFSNLTPLVGPGAPTLLAADVQGDVRNELILYQTPRVRVLQLEAGQLQEKGEYASSAPPAIADLDGDGANELVLCDVQPAAEPSLQAITPSKNNAVLWSVTMPPPGRPGLPQPRIAYLRLGRFLGRTTPDLYLWAGTPVVRSAVLDGRSGAMVWDKGEIPGNERYWGPSVNQASVYDFNQDGKEDLVFTNPDYYCIADGGTGDLLLGPEFPPKIFDQPSQGLYTLPALLTYTGAAPDVALASGHYFQGGMTIKARAHWYAMPAAGENRVGSEGFFKAPDGSWRIGFGRQNGNFACLDAVNGKVLWEYPLESSASDVASGDVDGDGQEEFVFGTSHGGLYAIGDDNGKPQEVWRKNFLRHVASPILADLNGDGTSEIIVYTGDGRVQVLGATL